MTDKELNGLRRKVERRDRTIHRLEVAACFITGLLIGITAYAIVAMWTA